jgi:cytidylate kinase
MSTSPINIAIDGFSASGKSTLARLLADKMNYLYLDTGSMYRAVTYYFITHKIDLQNTEQVRSALESIVLKFKRLNGYNEIYLNDQNLSEAIRNPEISDKVSAVAEVSAVRRFLVEQQKKIAKNKGVIMDGRDIGTVVLPDAELKIYLTTQEKIRLERRWEELRAKNPDLTLEQVKINLRSRDITDSTRVDSPLRIAPNAVIIDNSTADINQTVDQIYNLAQNIISSL